MDILDPKKFLAEQSPSEGYSFPEEDVQLSSNNVNTHSPDNVKGNNYSNFPPKYILNLSLKSERTCQMVANDVQYGILNQEENKYRFNDESACKSFLKKLYIILLVHNLILFSTISIFAICPPVIAWVGTNNILVVIGCCMLLVVLFILAINEKMCRSFPRNLIMFFVFTKAISLIFGYISVKSNTTIFFVISICLTIGVYFVLILFSIQNKFNLTVCRNSFLIVFVLLIEIVSIKALLNPTILELALPTLGTSIFLFYMIYDTQLMINEKHEYSINPKEYVFAALIFYIDIINIPLHISRIIRGIKIRLNK
ncbi:protein lifeguard 1-like [Condylostylus longicornis]|uniref:protein lifeguard 1-like n=1 Tax=Condylostylus longicornis TaxID=2530218 RepID=UPI00244E5581|nr:protein lifeguard 1-like [Condylostylus longicornis]